jgi:hypothetical protein
MILSDKSAADAIIKHNAFLDVVMEGFGRGLESVAVTWTDGRLPQESGS